MWQKKTRVGTVVPRGRHSDTEGVGTVVPNKDTNTINTNNIYIKQFEEFYNLYPKKQNKSKTEDWFIKNKVSEELFKSILSKLELFKKSKQWSNIEFIPQPTSWLNQKRWEDELITDTIKIQKLTMVTENNLREV